MSDIYCDFSLFWFEFIRALHAGQSPVGELHMGNLNCVAHCRKLPLADEAPVTLLGLPEWWDFQFNLFTHNLHKRILALYENK